MISKAIILTALVATMTTSPVDYATIVADYVCIPLQRTMTLVTSSFETLVDFLIVPLIHVSASVVYFIETVFNIITSLSINLLNLLDTIVAETFNVIKSLLTKTASVFKTCVDLLFRVVFYRGSVYDKDFQDHSARSWYLRALFATGKRILTSAVWCLENMKYFVCILLLQWAIKQGALLVIHCARWLLCSPLVLTQMVLNTSGYWMKLLFSLPFEAVIYLSKSLVYTGIYPYVYMVYSSVGCGLATLIVPDLLRHYNITLDDIRDNLRRLGYTVVTGNHDIGPSGATSRSDDVTSESDVDKVMDILARQQQMGYDARECIVCYEKKDFVTVHPCRHSNMCRQCIDQIQSINNKCPICRKDIWCIL